MDNDENKDKLSEPVSDYKNHITITTLADLEERDREYTRKMTHAQRMEYLQKLIHITYGEEDLLELEKKFNDGRMIINKGIKVPE